MTVNTTIELFTCLFSFLSGISAGVMYDFLSLLVSRNGKIISVLKDIFYFTLIALVSINVIRTVNDGVFRIYEFVFMTFGIIGYMLLFGNTVRKILKVLLHLVYRICKTVATVLFYPLIFIFKCVKRIFLKKYLKISKKISKNRLTLKQICFRIIMYMDEVKRFYKRK